MRPVRQRFAGRCAWAAGAWLEGQCQLLKSALTDPTSKYSYALDIKEILVFGEVAIVRLVWTLTVKQDGSETTSLEPGMDVFRRQADGTWKIIRYIAYEQ